MRGDSLTAEQTKAIEAMQGSYWGIVKHQAPKVTRYQSWWMYRFFFDYFSPMLLGIVDAIMLLCRSTWFGGVKRAFAAVGRMAFTNYIMTSIICAFVFYGFGFELYGELRRHQLYYVVGSIWLFQLIVSPLWLARFRFGPLEWLWRWLTYGERPAMRGPANAGPA